MCSVEEREGREAIPREKSTRRLVQQCMKCDNQAVAVARTKDPFCRGCFEGYFTHRFRATFGKSRLIRTGEHVLLAFSGGLSSRVLLSLAVEGLHKEVHKKLRFTPSVVVIDEGAVLSKDWLERCHCQAEVLAIAAESGFPTLFTHLEQVFGCCETYCLEELLQTTRLQSTAGGEGSCPLDSDREDRPIGAQLCGESEGGLQPAGSLGECGHSPHAERPCMEPLCPNPGVGGEKGREVGEVGKEGELPKDKGPAKDRDLKALIADRLQVLTRDEEMERQLKTLFAATKTATAKENLLLSLRQQLLVEIARRHQVTKVLVGDNATRLAVRLLGNVAQGRGATLPLDTGFADSRVKDITFVRPLREFPVREVASYATLHRLQIVTIPSLTTLAPEKTSIERLTESFITGLQADFPSTTSTIFRTGDKLSVDEEMESIPCALCQAPCGMGTAEVFSHLRLPQSLMGEGPEASDSLARQVWQRLCYGCQLTVRDMKCNVHSLPPFVLDTSTRARMKEEVREFLLEDS